MKLKNLYLPIFALFPFSAFASDSITYSIAAKMIDTMQYFSLGLFHSIAAAYKPLYVSIAIIGLTILTLKYMWTGITPIKEMFSFLLSMMISSSFAFDSYLFKTVIYDTFFDTLYALNQFVIAANSQNMMDIGNMSFNSIEGMFRTIDNSLMYIAKFAWSVWKQNDNFLTSTAIFFEAIIIYLLYLFIGVYFLIIFSVSVLGAHMMIILMPITLSLYPFKKFRQYTTNSLMGMVYYGLVTLFACISISLVVFIADGLVVDAKNLTDAAAGGKISFPADFFTGSIMIGLLSIFIIKMAPEFASRVLNAASTQIGGAAPIVIAGGVSAAKMAAAGAITASSKAYPYVKSGASNTRSFVIPEISRKPIATNYQKFY